jgi:hypothetical protein
MYMKVKEVVVVIGIKNNIYRSKGIEIRYPGCPVTLFLNSDG